jgi:ribosome maturation factor RimP
MSDKVADKVTRLIEPIFREQVALEQIKLVDVTYKKEGNNWYLRIFIDKENGITLDDCQIVSGYVSNLIDIHDPIPSSYFLEVSSPGIERPLKKKEAYDKYKGQLIKIKTYAPFEGKKEFVGILQGLLEDQVILEINGTELKIPLEKVASANLTIE